MAKSVKLTLRRGRYFAGVDIPFFVPNSAIVDGVEELGGQAVTITDREDAQLPFDPREDPKYSDSWEEVVTADYPGPTKTIDTPRRWKWLMVIAAPATSSSAPSSAPSSSTPAPVPEKRSSGAGGVLLVLGVAAAAAAGVALWKRRRP